MTQSQKDKILKVLGENKAGLTASQVTKHLQLELTFAEIGKVRSWLEHFVDTGLATKTNENRYQLVFGGYDPSGDAA